MAPPKDPQKREEWLRNTRAANQKRKGTKRPPEVGAKISASKLANPYQYTDEQRKKMATNKGKKQRPEVVAKRANAIRGRKHTLEARARMSAALKGNRNGAGTKGYKHTEETKQKLSEINKNRPSEVLAKISVSWFPKGNIPYGAGKPLADEHKAKISAANKGKKHTEELKQRQSQMRKGHPVTPETRAKISKSRMGLPCPPLALERSMGARKNSSIELFTASKLDTMGTVYEKQKRIGNYWVDFYIPEENKVIEVNGCFWHYCDKCGFNSEGSQKKRELDAKRYKQLQSKGYVVEVIWEHDLRKEMKAMEWRT